MGAEPELTETPGPAADASAAAVPSAPDGARAHVPAPGRGVTFDIEVRATPGYRLCRGIVRVVVRIMFRPRVTGRENVPASGPVILAPVHRSGIDFVFAAFTTDRKLFFMAKDSLWKTKALGWLLLRLGVFPVHRESADREALSRAEEVLRRGALLVLFPEGTRQEGDEVQPLLEGASFLAARTGATVVPVGIGNSDKVMPKGAKLPKPLPVRIVIGEALPPPARGASGRVSRSKVHAASQELRDRVQHAYDQARA
jgi:1-acyl-sn-glycerol-3-phosphate acyltransferase